jgi:uncharacterized membrane protein
VIAKLGQGAEMTVNPRNFGKDEPREAVSLDAVLERNIRALVERRKEEEAAVTKQGRAVARITGFIGSLWFVYFHVVIFGVWVAANRFSVAGIPRFDPDLVYIATFASIEAIFLTTFVLITQNRMASAAHKRAELDLQISLLTEHELTKLIAVVAAVAKRLGVTTEVDEDLAELKQDVVVASVLDKIDSANETVPGEPRSYELERAT